MGVKLSNKRVAYYIKALRMVKKLRDEFSLVEGDYAEHLGKLLEALAKTKMLEYREFDLERLTEARDLLPRAISIVGNYYSLCHTVIRPAKDIEGNRAMYSKELRKLHKWISARLEENFVA